MSEKYWGSTYRAHQKMRPSKRRKLNKEMKYDTTICIENPTCDINITLEDGRKVDCEIKTNIFLC